MHDEREDNRGARGAEHRDVSAHVSFHVRIVAPRSAGG
jgi:hypothetical protein